MYVKIPRHNMNTINDRFPPASSLPSVYSFIVKKKKKEMTNVVGSP